MRGGISGICSEAMDGGGVEGFELQNHSFDHKSLQNKD